jgi:hypothetical protein
MNNIEYPDICKKTGTGPIAELDSRPFFKNLLGWQDIVGAEIGVRYGCNALRILHNLDIKLLYLIDIKITDHAKLNLAKFENKIKWIKAKSHEAYKEIEDSELDFVYIDGNHHYNHVRKDIQLYIPKVNIQGYIAGHDYKDNGLGNQVKKAVHSIFGDKVYTDENPDYWDWWIRKPEIW